MQIKKAVLDMKPKILVTQMQNQWVCRSDALQSKMVHYYYNYG